MAWTATLTYKKNPGTGNIDASISYESDTEPELNFTDVHSGNNITTDWVGITAGARIAALDERDVAFNLLTPGKIDLKPYPTPSPVQIAAQKVAAAKQLEFLRAASSDPETQKAQAELEAALAATAKTDIVSKLV